MAVQYDTHEHLFNQVRALNKQKLRSAVGIFQSQVYLVSFVVVPSIGMPLFMIQMVHGVLLLLSELSTIVNRLSPLLPELRALTHQHSETLSERHSRVSDAAILGVHESRSAEDWYVFVCLSAESP